MNSRGIKAARIVTLTLSTLALGTLAACNTVSGMGTDIEQTSDNTKKAFGGTPDPAPGQTKQGDTQK
jgi:predicted small secreted protein